AAGQAHRAGHALGGAVAGGLLLGTQHQEDGVVDAQRDEEDQRVQRHGDVEGGEAEDVLRDQRTGAERRHGGERRGHEQEDGGDDGAEDDHQQEEDDHQDDRDDQQRVAGGGVAGVQRLGGLAADERLGVGFVGGLAQGLDFAEGVGGGRLGVGDDGEAGQRAVERFGRRALELGAVDGLDGLGHLA